MFNFPWSNFHELNLDWILSVVKEAKEIFVKGEGDIQHAVETADQALETAEQAAAGVIADGAVTIPKLNSEVYSLLAYCVSGSVAPNFIPEGALVILRNSTIYNVTDGIYTATRNIPQAAIITAADLDQSATLYREGGMNYLLHNEEKLSGTIDLIKAGLVILVTGDEASASVPADGLVYVANNTHGLNEGFYFNSSGATFPTTGGTADADSFTAVNNILNALQTAVATLGSDDITNDSTVTGASVTDALDAVKNTLTQLDSAVATLENAIGNKKIKIVAGVIRNDGTGWAPITTGDHVPINISSCSVNSNGDIVVNYGFTAKNVISLIVGCDETFAEVYDVGSSVDLSLCRIRVFKKPVSVGGYVYYDGSNWDVSYSTFTSASFSGGDLQLNFSSSPFSEISDKYKMMLTANGRDCDVQAGQIGPSGYVKIRFVNSSGSVITTPTTACKAYVVYQSQRVQVDASTIVSNSGDFWILGLMEVD